MGIQERKDRDREVLRSRILEAATNLFVTQGFEKTSMRAIASAVEYSPASLYLHFENKEQIMEALFTQVFTLFTLKLMEAGEEKDPIKRLNLVGHKYIEFAVMNPAYYELMFLIPHPNMDMKKMAFSDVQEDCNDEGGKAGMQGFQFLHECIAGVAASGKTLRYDLYTASLNAWATVHGICCLYIRGFSVMYPPELLPSMMYQSAEAIYHSLFID